ncbi:hypothetical protein ANCDUO_19647 [Ancylostoma duodenale]|uniref:Uncharacterized protein n=1 Tax=Ancylostoma duodenale TaxID=51022 RepID=A0A0C2FNV0_9BILA|nr:hypothetical protein ANCDUO_19647 [Ancylostoma duodenale]
MNFYKIFTRIILLSITYKKEYLRTFCFLYQLEHFKATDILTKLNAAHEAGQQNAGIDIWKHGKHQIIATGSIIILITFYMIILFTEVMDAAENYIFDLYAGKKLAIKLATDAAATILKVDQIIIAKQATGGPKPRGPKPQDEDDEGMA